MEKMYIDDWRSFSGKLLTKESISQMPESLEKEHISKVREMLMGEGFDADSFRVGELPVEGVYYFERAVPQKGMDYFSVTAESDGSLIPQYTTIEYDEDGLNTFACNTIKESIEKHEC